MSERRSFHFFSILTRVRLAPNEVAVDAPDVVVVMIALWVAIHVVIGSLVSGPAGSWPWALGVALFCGLAPRMHLRVSPGRVIFVRTIAWIPWRFARCRPVPEEDFTVLDYDEGYLLAAPTRDGQSDDDDKAMVLSAHAHGVGEKTITDIANAAQAALGTISPGRLRF